MNQKFDYAFARKVMQDKNNPIARYLKFYIEHDVTVAVPSTDYAIAKLQKEIMVLFGYNPNNPEQYARTKYLLGSIEKIIGYYFYNLGVHKDLIVQFYTMRLTQESLSETAFRSIAGAISMFLAEKKTRKFILGESKPYIEGLSPEEFVWIPEDQQHDYSTAILQEKLKEK